MTNLSGVPRCSQLDGSTLKIKKSYTEAGKNCEANCVTIVDRDGREAVYVPIINEGEA